MNDNEPQTEGFLVTLLYGLGFAFLVGTFRLFRLIFWGIEAAIRGVIKNDHYEQKIGLFALGMLCFSAGIWLVPFTNPGMPFEGKAVLSSVTFLFYLWLGWQQLRARE